MMGATAVIIAAVAAVSAAPAPQKELIRAHSDVRPALTSIHLLTTSIQGTLKSLEWDFGWWGKQEAKAAAGKEFDAWSAAIGDFRTAAEAVSALNDPFSTERAALENSPAVRKAAAQVPGSISERVADIRLLRGEYDADAARQALGRARGAAKILDDGNLLKVNDAQREILETVGGLSRHADALRSRIAPYIPDEKTAGTPGDAEGRKRVEKQFLSVREDCEALRVEIARLELFFSLNNLLEKTK